MSTKHVKDSQITMTQLMMPADANAAGYVHGGTILKMVDTAAAVCAIRHAGNQCVTASVERVDFKQPITIGELVTLKASVVYVGKTSLQIGIRVEAEDLKTARKKHTNSCYVTCVALNKKGKPTLVPRLILATAEEKRRWEEAEERRTRFLNTKKT